MLAGCPQAPIKILMRVQSGNGQKTAGAGVLLNFKGGSLQLRSCTGRYSDFYSSTSRIKHIVHLYY
jgi:hypothetical protein